MVSLQLIFEKSSPKALIWEKASDHIFWIFRKLVLTIKKQLTDIFWSCHENVKLNVVFKSPNRIRNAFHFKEQLPKSNNSKVLYKYTSDTWKSVYIDKTKRHLLVRQYKHLGTTIFTDKELKYNEKDAAAIWKHYRQHQYNSRLDNFKFLGNAVNNFHLLIK